MEVVKDAGFFCDWHERIRTYPGGPRLFKMICEGVRLGDEFDEFFANASLVAKSVQQGALKRDVSCRYCWFLAGAMTSRPGTLCCHKHCVGPSAVCGESRCRPVRCEKRQRGAAPRGDGVA